MMEQFIATLNNDEEIVKGLKVDALEFAIVEMFGLPLEGEEFLARENAISTKN